MKKWQALKSDIEASFKAMQTAEPEELRLIRTGEVDNQAGSYGQYWTSLDFTNGMIRDLSMYTMYPILKMARDDDFSLLQIQKMYMTLHPPYTEYLGYSGLYELRKFCRRFRECFEEFENKDEFMEIYSSFLIYANKLAAWSYHYFPWEIGFSWKQPNAK